MARPGPAGPAGRAGAAPNAALCVRARRACRCCPSSAGRRAEGIQLRCCAAHWRAGRHRAGACHMLTQQAACAVFHAGLSQAPCFFPYTCGVFISHPTCALIPERACNHEAAHQTLLLHTAVAPAIHTQALTAFQPPPHCPLTSLYSLPSAPIGLCFITTDREFSKLHRLIMLPYDPHPALTNVTRGLLTPSACLHPEYLSPKDFETNSPTDFIHSVRCSKPRPFSAAHASRTPLATPAWPKMAAQSSQICGSKCL